MSAISWGAAPSAVRTSTSAAASWKSAGTAASRSNWRAASSGRFSKTVIRLSCAAGARATAIASALAKSKARSCRLDDDDRINSAFLRRNISNAGRMLNQVVQAVGQMHPLVRWRTLLHRHSRPPFLRRPDRPRDKTAAAVRAHIVQLVLDAVRTERAFVTADARFHRSWRKILVAILAVRPELQRHGRLVMSGRYGSSQISCRTQMPNLPRFRPSPARLSLQLLERQP